MYIPLMDKPKDLITATEARQLLGVSEKKMAKLMKTIRHFSNPLDKRVKYVSKAEILRLKDSYEEAA